MAKFQVWHIPQVPMKAFVVEVDDVHEAFRLSGTLAMYDLFQYKNRVKPDYCNATGVNVWFDNEWVSIEPDEVDDPWWDEI